MAKEGERAGEPTRAEEALRESEEKYRNIFETAPDGIVTVDLKGIVTSCNSAFTSITGFSESEIVGKHFSKLPTLRARDIPKYMKMFNSLIRGKVPKPFEARWLHKDGTVHWAEIHASLMKKGRKIIGLQAIERDITERKRAEEALRESEEKYRTILESIEDGYYQVDIAGNLTFFNNALCRIFGYPEDELMGMNNRQYMDEETAKAVYQTFNAVYRTGKPARLFDYEIIRKDGGRRSIEASVSLISGSTGEPAGFRGIIRDITERKRAEEEIRRRSEELAALNAVAMTVSSTLDLQEVLHAIQERVMESLAEVYPPLFFLFNEKDQTFKIVPTRMQEQGLRRVERLIGTNLEKLSFPLPALEPALREALLAGKPQVTDDCSGLLELGISRELIKDAQRALEIKWVVGLPLWVKGKFTGIMILFSPKEKIPEEEIELLSAIATQAAIAIENARLYEEAQARSAYLATLLRINATLRSTLPLSQVLETIVQGAAEALDYVGSLITVPDATGERLVLGGVWGGRFVDAAVRLTGFKVESFSLPLKAEENPIVRAYLTGELQAWSRAPERIVVGVEPPISPKLARVIERAMGAKLAACVPLPVGDKAVGVLTVFSPREQLPDEERRMLLGLADQAGLAMENARLFEERRRKAEELAALYDVSLDVAAQLDLDTLLKTILLRAMELLRANAGGLYLYHPERQDLELIVAQGLSKDYTGIRLALGEGACGKVAQSGEPLVVTDYANWEGRSPHLADEPTFNVLAVPIKRGDTLLGAFYVDDPDVERRFEEGDIRLATLFASQAAIAIQNARLFQETTTRYRQLSTLQKINATLRSTLPVTEVLATIAQETAKGLGIADVLIGVPDETGQRLEFGAGSGGRHEEISRKVTKRLTEAFTLPLTERENAIVKAYHAGEIQRVSAEEPYLLTRGVRPQVSDQAAKLIARLMGTPEALCVPLPFGDRVMGVMVAFAIREANQEQLALLSAIADQAGIAIENARLYEQTDEKLRDRVAELTALNAIAQSLASTLELDEMLESIVTRVAQMMQARICTIRLVEGNKLTIGAAVGYRDESSRQHTMEIDQRLARIVRDQRPLLVEDLWQSEDIPPSRRMRAWREGVHSFLGVPMISKGETIGVLSIYGKEPHHFAQEEVGLLSTIANQAAIAIESARPYERAKEHAEELERLVQERTRELQAIHAELLQSAKLAALGQLAAGVAHELNNPLGAISGYLELLQEEMDLGPRETEYVERIEKRIQQSTKIVAELKSLGIPSKPVWQIVDVNNILEETLTLVERRLSLHQIKVQKDITPDLPLMHADPDRLEQVFINLITNARQAMREGGTLKVTSRESRNGEWVEIILADTGEGIAKHHLDKIFDPFFTTRGPGEAMGLGLSISHRHIKDHGGAVDVWSEKGRGTVFRVVLPPSGAKRCWEIIDCDKKGRCGAVRENAEYRCWSVMKDVSRCERCEVYRRKALPPLDGTLLPT